MAEWLSVQDASKQFGVPERTLWRWIKNDTVSSRKVGRRREVMASSVAVVAESGSHDQTEVSELPDPKDELIASLRDQITVLRDQVQEKDKQIAKLQDDIAEASHRHDTVVMQMTRLLEYHQQPFWRKLFSRKALPPPVDETIVDMETSEDKETGGK